MPKWEAFIVDINAVIKGDRKVNQKMIWFSNGIAVTKELVDLKTGNSFSDNVSPTFKPEFYKKENLIYGNTNAKHKVAIFSDPLCPFCRSFVPEAINYMKKYPNKFAVYYYHFPLPSLHPAAVELVNAAVAVELKGRKNVVLDLYKVKVNPKEKSVPQTSLSIVFGIPTILRPSSASKFAVFSVPFPPIQTRQSSPICS